jgi:hypothetical protein
LAIVFNGYTLPTTFNVMDMGLPSTAPSAKIPRRDGATLRGQFLNERVIRVEGAISSFDIGGNPQTILSQRDAIMAGLAGMGSLYLDSARYFRNVVARTIDPRFGGGQFNRSCDFSIEFATGDPYEYSDTLSAASGAVSASPTTFNINGVGGTAKAKPAIAMTVGGAGAVTLNATLVNNTTSETCTLKGTATAGDVITIDSLLETVTNQSGTNVMALFDGVFPSLALGNNSFTLTYTGTALTAWAASYRARYR